MRARLSLVLAVTVTHACTCGGDTTIGRVVPRLELAVPALDFGEVPVGATKRIALELLNTGGAPLAVSALKTDAPFAVAIERVEVLAAGRARIDVAFTPVDAGLVQGSLQISSDADGTPMVSVALSGTGVPGYLELRPRVVEFSDTRVGTSRRIELVLDNRGLEAISGPIVADGFARPEHYSLAGVADVSRGASFSAAARAETPLELEYLPLSPGDDGGRLIFEVCGERCGVDLTVVADAVAASVRVEPVALDLGEVGIGTTKSEVVQVWNDGARALLVGRVRILGSAEVSVSTARPLPAEVAPGASLVLTLEYQPAAATEMLSTLSIDTNDEGAPEARVRVSGRGVGPLFQVLPPAINFGIVHRTVAQRRSFILLNAGSADVRVNAVRYSGHPSMRLVGVPGLPVRLGAGETITPSVELVPTGTSGIYLGEVQVETDDPAHADVRIPVQAAFSETACQLESSPARLNFGLVTPPHARSQEVTLTNAGDRPCTLLSGAFEAPVDSAFVVGMTNFPVTLMPSQSVRVAFRFQPTDLRESKGIYTLMTDDAVFPDRRVTLVGSSLAYDDLFVVPNAIDFGQLEPRCTGRARPLRIFNAGTVDAWIDRVNLTGAAAEIQVGAGSLPHLIRPGDVWQLGAAYAPTDLGVDEGEIEIVPRDRPYSLVTTWRGEGVAQAVITDVFEQGEARPVDVLFVVDDSCSMGEEQVALTNNFVDFIRTANVRSVDFRIAITTTDVTGNNGGVLRGPIMSPSTPDLEREFTQQASVGILGSGFEQGLEAMDRVFRQTTNRGSFLRAMATLVVIIVSDEDDGSPASAVTYFNAMRAVATDYFVATITGQTRGCRNVGAGDALPAPKYEGFVGLTNGLSLSICAPWSSTLGNLGAAVFGLQQRFALANAADTSAPIVVRVNGQTVPTTDWSYDAAASSIVFDAAQLPPEGATIEITYSPDC